MEPLFFLLFSLTPVSLNALRLYDIAQPELHPLATTQRSIVSERKQNKQYLLKRIMLHTSTTLQDSYAEVTLILRYSSPVLVAIFRGFEKGGKIRRICVIRPHLGGFILGGHGKQILETVGE